MKIVPLCIMPKQRLDSLMVERGLVENRSKAQALIMAGEVMVNGTPMTKAGTPVAAEAQIVLAGRQRYVSRGGLKLEHALKEFNLTVDGLTCLDVGASTGGFTDCLLQHGASRVYALDVGYGQIDYTLRKDGRVTVMDRVNAHYEFALAEKVQLAVMDVSFISLSKVIPNVLPHIVRDGSLVALFKPQFEAGRDEVGKGGVIRDPLVHARTIGRFVVWMNENRLALLGLAVSPVEGAEGNREFLLHMRRSGE
jgi:23S rRNA (cytidine1920-2'-O)/16S rRNA (cytidine1409-2'-O)-methyltransferase